MIVHPMPDPVAFSIGPLAVHWYGLMYLLGFVFFFLVGRIRIRLPHFAKEGWSTKDLDDLLFYGILGVILGGRLGEVLFYHPVYFFHHPAEIFMVWKGGMSYHGGFIGVLFAAWLWCRRHRRSWINTLDLVGPLMPFGYAAGRIGNFINAELPGKIADPSLPWAMVFPNYDMMPRHPSPLYQALVDGLLMFVILWMYARRERPPGAVAGMYIFLYGACRFVTEIWRIPDYEVPCGFFTISAGQLLSLPMVAAGLLILWISYRHARRVGWYPGSPPVSGRYF